MYAFFVRACGYLAGLTYLKIMKIAKSLGFSDLEFSCSPVQPNLRVSLSEPCSTTVTAKKSSLKKSFQSQNKINFGTEKVLWKKVL